MQDRQPTIYRGFLKNLTAGLRAVRQPLAVFVFFGFIALPNPSFAQIPSWLCTLMTNACGTVPAGAEEICNYFTKICSAVGDIGMPGAPASPGACAAPGDPCATAQYLDSQIKDPTSSDLDKLKKKVDSVAKTVKDKVKKLGTQLTLAEGQLAKAARQNMTQIVTNSRMEILSESDADIARRYEPSPELCVYATAARYLTEAEGFGRAYGQAFYNKHIKWRKLGARMSGRQQEIVLATAAMAQFGNDKELSGQGVHVAPANLPDDVVDLDIRVGDLLDRDVFLTDQEDQAAFLAMQHLFGVHKTRTRGPQLLRTGGILEEEEYRAGIAALDPVIRLYTEEMGRRKIRLPKKVTDQRLLNWFNVEREKLDLPKITGRDPSQREVELLVFEQRPTSPAYLLTFSKMTPENIERESVATGMMIAKLRQKIADVKEIRHLTEDALATLELKERHDTRADTATSSVPMGKSDVYHP